VTRFVRFRDSSGEPRWGRRAGDEIEVLSAAPWQAPTVTGRSNAAVELLAPAEPTKVLALAYNYKSLFADPAAMASKNEAHFSDPGFEPLVFLKGPNSVNHPNGTIRVPRNTEVWIEVEITAVIGRRARNLRDGNAAREIVAGLTIGNDVTALNILRRDWHLARSKSLDGFCPLGPELVTELDDRALALETRIDGRITQHASSNERVLDTYEAVAMTSRIMTLEPGDVVLTGTPAGARQSLVVPGNRVELSIEGIGTLSSSIVEDV
jgi:2-keto-4-pentenoate hydratase/2-oxohepta-3-ene-1,7-dioic acid hydratase in catechol pathway